ncbi:T-complex protein 1 subunit gamma-like isoform X2 [Hylaeus volcanicus]|nr:T-complex protein 1 subunit gamma-like isoform X2 [Hylaeus volcanicus]
MGGIVLTNDGNAILREVDVSHPAAKSVIDLSRCQDEEVGDGTTSVVILTGELLTFTEPLLKKQIHPTQIVSGFLKTLDDCLEIMEASATTVDLSNTEQIRTVIESCLNTKFSDTWNRIIPPIALRAVSMIAFNQSGPSNKIDIKNCIKVEKIPGGTIDDTAVYDGIVLNKDITHPKMRRYIINPRIVLLDCPLEYKKGESQTLVEITKEEDWDKILKQEEEEVKKMCEDIIAVGCDIVITEKGVSDLAQHFFVKAGISAIRRVRKSDNNRLAKISGATIATRTNELCSFDVGTKCGLFEIKKIGDEYFSYFINCEKPQACTVLLRGGSKDILNEVERNLQDALNVARNVYTSPKLLPGGGAIEMEISARLSERCTETNNMFQWPYKAVAAALEVLPRTLVQNCGANVVRTMTALRAQHASKGNHFMGVNGETGEIIDVTSLGIWDTFAVKQQVLRTAIEATCMIIRIDDVLSATKKNKDPSVQMAANNEGQADRETFGDTRDG